jgi:hypothetical protein
MNLPGQPDRYISHRSWHGWIEFKDEKTKLKPIQAMRIKEMNERAPGTAYVARFIGDEFLNIEDHEGNVLLEGANAPIAFLNGLALLTAAAK